MKQAKLEPTNDSYLEERIKNHVAKITPRFGVVENVHPHSEEEGTSNYKVDVRVPRDESGGGASTVPHEYVPVAVSNAGAVYGIEEGSLVFVEYRRGNSDRPVVTQVLYDDSEPAPFSHPGDWRQKIGEAVVEIITKEDGTQQLNIGRQPDDREGIDAGFSINLDDGSFAIHDGSEKGLFVDGDGNMIQNWESFASPWGAAGPVDWEGEPGSGGSEETYEHRVIVVDSEGEPVEGANVTVEEIN